jgi:hypothetical protein
VASKVRTTTWARFGNFAAHELRPNPLRVSKLGKEHPELGEAGSGWYLHPAHAACGPHCPSRVLSLIEVSSRITNSAREPFAQFHLTQWNTILHLAEVQMRQLVSMLSKMQRQFSAIATRSVFATAQHHAATSAECIVTVFTITL